MAKQSTPRRSGTGGLLVPASGVVNAEGRVKEQVGEEKIGGNERDGTPKRDMIQRWNHFLRKHIESSSPSAKPQSRMNCAREKCAHACVR